MKKLLKPNFLVLLSLIFAFSCGKRDSASTSSVYGASGVGVSVDGVISAGSASQAYNTIEEVRSAFDSMSLETGVTEGMNIYHIGSNYSSNSGGGFSFNICFNCDYSQQQLEQYLTYGRVLRVQNLDSNANSLNLGLATSVQNNDYVYDNYVYSRDSDSYKEMLGRNLSFSEVKMSNAMIELSDGQRIPGVLVEYINKTFTEVTSIKRYVLSTNLPVIANPIAEIEGNLLNSNSIAGILRNVGTNIQVKKIEIDNISELYYGQLYDRNWTININ